MGTTLTIDMASWIASINKALPQFAPVVNAAVPVLQTWANDQITAWIALFSTDTDAALEQLWAAMSETQALAAADAAATATETAANDASAFLTQMKTVAKDALTILVTVASALVAL